MTDTNGLIYSIETSDLYQDMREDLLIFDTSEYPRDNSCYSNTDKKVVGVFKDKTCGRSISEFTELRAKCYSILLSDKFKRKGGQR